jgi:hypothetical protein
LLVLGLKLLLLDLLGLCHHLLDLQGLNPHKLELHHLHLHRLVRDLVRIQHAGSVTGVEGHTIWVHASWKLMLLLREAIIGTVNGGCHEHRSGTSMV